MESSSLKEDRDPIQPPGDEPASVADHPCGWEPGDIGKGNQYRILETVGQASQTRPEDHSNFRSLW
jgi:hypothetical protein